jgi:hypothetical protein
MDPASQFMLALHPGILGNTEEPEKTHRSTIFRNRRGRSPCHFRFMLDFSAAKFRAGPFRRGVVGPDWARDDTWPRGKSDESSPAAPEG